MPDFTGRGRLRHRSAAQAAAQGIKDHIRNHGLVEGDLLPSEADMCEDLGCSRSSIREAVRTLATLDIVEVRHGYGTFVSGMSLSPLVEGLVFRTLVDSERAVERMRNIVEVRYGLDTAVTTGLMGALTPERAEELHGVVAQMRAHAEAGEPFLEEDHHFHTMLMSHVKNHLVRELSDAMWRVQMQVAPAMGLATSKEWASSVDSHDEMVDAIVAEDSGAYRAAVRRHYRSLLDALAKTDI
ncbi:MULTISPECIES: FadR/GntR family transcriptional regulator [Corynebacterium]|uniref:FadR/GntR family transcriptional regulator n=1 Tax=Corynebacterium TaxID=1716 RepID=UPI0025511C60|nr:MULTISPECIES: FCD domain-containing protein [Corynebacterium]MDK6260019.1 FCD domain-containing protein [Corynebacterium frankenforstense]MDK8895183.1 FCD domain-containing protein [Corynebacterium sp. MSK006]